MILITHFEQRQGAFTTGKAMVVCMSRRICIDLYKAIQKLRPNWHHNDDAKGAIKVVMTGSGSYSLAWQEHIYNKKTREDIAKQFALMMN